MLHGREWRGSISEITVYARENRITSAAALHVGDHAIFISAQSIISIGMSSSATGALYTLYVLALE